MVGWKFLLWNCFWRIFRFGNCTYKVFALLLAVVCWGTLLPNWPPIKCSRIGSSSNHAWEKMGWRIPHPIISSSFHHKIPSPRQSGASAVVSSMPDSSNRGAKLVSFDVELSLSNTLVLELLSNLSTTTHSCKPFKTHEKNTEHLSTAGFTRCKGAILQHKPTQTHTNWHIGYHILRAQTWCLHKRRTRSKMPQQLMFEHQNFPTEGLPFTANHLASLPVPQGQPQPEASRPKAMYEMEVQTFGIPNTAWNLKPGTNFRHSYEMTTRNCISCKNLCRAKNIFSRTSRGVASHSGDSRHWEFLCEISWQSCIWFMASKQPDNNVAISICTSSEQVMQSNNDNEGSPGHNKSDPSPRKRCPFTSTNHAKH